MKKLLLEFKDLWYDKYITDGIIRKGWGTMLSKNERNKPFGGYNADNTSYTTKGYAAIKQILDWFKSKI